MIAKVQVIFVHAEGKQPVFAEIFPVAEPFEVGAGLAEKFKFHLFEFAQAEGEISGRDFVAERFAYLTDAERYAHTRGTLHVFEVHENALRRFRTEIDGIRGIFRNALKRFEHQIEFADGREIGFAADGAGNFMLRYERLQFVGIHAFHRDFEIVLFYVFFHEIIGTVARFAVFAVHQRIGKAA